MYTVGFGTLDASWHHGQHLCLLVSCVGRGCEGLYCAWRWARSSSTVVCAVTVESCQIMRTTIASVEILHMDFISSTIGVAHCDGCCPDPLDQTFKL